MRKLTKTLAVVSLLAPIDSFALGIGDIKLYSALNQILNAEITLNLEANESIDDVKVSMAPIEKFDELGVPYTAELFKIKFEPIVNANGKALIKLTSEETIQEPFLNFLVKIRWPTGSQYRDFTVLVDPPATYLQPIIPVSTAPDVNVRNSASDFTTSPYSSQTITQSSSFNAAGGRVRVNDTLWEMAERANVGKSSSIEQMMIAIYQANPGAFYQNNVNTLSAGAIINLPDNEAVLRLSVSQAKAEFARQNQQWRDRSTMPSSLASSKAGSQLKLIAPDTVGIDQQMAVASKDVDGSMSMAGMSQGVGNAELTARLEELERKLAAMQVTLAIKDEQLAAIQAGGMDPQQSVTSTEIETPTETLVEGEQKPESEVEAEVKPESEMAKPKPEMVKPEPVVETKPMSKPAPVQEESSYFTWVAVIMALIAGLLGWLWWRKRKIESVTAEESMFSSAFTSPGAEISEISQMGSTPVSDDFSYQTGNIGESSISSEFTPSDFDAFDTDQSEVDPISEADVYLAYGRYQQAEELMRQAIKDQPNRDECKLKLLEIFYANENAQEFENYANELKASGKEQDQEFWIRVVEMGSEICPSVALFNNSTEQEGSSVSNVTDVVDEPESLEPDAKSASDSVAEDPELDAIDFEMPSNDSEADDTLESFDFDAGQASDGDGEDIEFDFDMSTDTDEESDDQGDELIDMDELETKIDLARAYVDMGDDDAAKTIAEEVLAIGNDAQKKEAKNILDSLK